MSETVVYPPPRARWRIQHGANRQHLETVALWMPPPCKSTDEGQTGVL